MDIKLNITRNIDPNRWDELLNKSSDATPFHLLSWITAWSLTFGYKPLFLVALDYNDSIIAGMPILEIPSYTGLCIEYHSLPWGGYGSIIMRDDAEPEIYRHIIIRFLDLLQRWNVNKGIAVDFNDNNPFWTHFATNIQESTAYILPLDRPIEDIYRQYDRSIKKNIRTAKKTNVIVRDIEKIDEVKTYHSITQAVARKYCREQYPRQLFMNIYRLMTPRGEAKFTLALRDNKPLAGVLHICNNRHVFNWLTASYPECYQYRPNEALISNIIEWASKKGAKIYNLGSSPNDAHGVIRFKRKWGTTGKTYKIYEVERISKIVKGINSAITLGRFIRSKYHASITTKRTILGRKS